MGQLSLGKVIDFHVHTFPKQIALKALESLSNTGHVKYFSEGSVESLISSMQKKGIDYSVNLPVMTRLDQVIQINDSMIKKKSSMEEQGIITFGGLHPEFEGYREEIKRLKASGIKGIKLHPAFQGIHINDIRYKRIIDAISEEGMISITHCGMDVSFLDENYASIDELKEVIDEVKPENMVLAHMGGWQDWDLVESELAGANVYLDTAYSFGPVYPREGHEKMMIFRDNLNSESFERIVKKHGSEKILFATDSPWADQGKYVDFVRNTELSDVEKNNILFENAFKLLGINVV